MVRNASFLNETNAGFAIKARELMAFENSPTSAQRGLVSISELELSMTAWKMTSIRRSYIFLLLGTMLTYIIVLDGLSSKCKATETLEVA
ncbi:hypothetical protein HNY73_022616 [Argiope bruennichi]|uniref:Uncharacterized protein n=1 Tax=Argiope bruennichi TaxID=94029 RepID=A0A8T0E282_ARGBR|nr:hypothetical protein HNY73_022616 [Argiope bruennichi]